MGCQNSLINTLLFSAVSLFPRSCFLCSKLRKERKKKIEMFLLLCWWWCSCIERRSMLNVKKSYKTAVKDAKRWKTMIIWFFYAQHKFEECPFVRPSFNRPTIQQHPTKATSKMELRQKKNGVSSDAAGQLYFKHTLLELCSRKGMCNIFARWV